jgi:hypothetical protein
MIKKNKKAAMEMSVGTIVTIVLLMAVLVLGISLTRSIFRGATESVSDLDAGVKQEINNLFGEENKDLVVSLGSQKTAQVKQGTENFGFVIGYAPDSPQLWRNGEGCRYALYVDQNKGTCIDQPDWNAQKIENWVKTGSGEGNFITFDEVDVTKGYALIKMDIPEEIAPCFQRFNVRVTCTGDPSYKSSYFDIDVIKKGLF